MEINLRILFSSQKQKQGDNHSWNRVEVPFPETIVVSTHRAVNSVDDTTPWHPHLSFLAWKRQNIVFNHIAVAHPGFRLTSLLCSFSVTTPAINGEKNFETGRFSYFVEMLLVFCFTFIQ